MTGKTGGRTSKVWTSMVLLFCLIQLPGTEAAAQDGVEEIDVPWHEPGTANRTPVAQQSTPELALIFETFPALELDFNEWKTPLRFSAATGEGFSFGGAGGLVLSTGGFLLYGGVQLNTLGGIHLSFLDGALPATMDLYLTTPRFGTYLWLGSLEGRLSDYTRTESMIGFGASFNPVGARLSWCGPACLFADVRLFDIYYWRGEEGDTLTTVAPITTGVGVAF